MRLPEKINDPLQTKHKKIYQTVNELIEFMEYFIRETDKCCSCNGCARHTEKPDLSMGMSNLRCCDNGDSDEEHDCLRKQKPQTAAEYEQLNWDLGFKQGEIKGFAKGFETCKKEMVKRIINEV